jgi:hypothetical protein
VLRRRGEEGKEGEGTGGEGREERRAEEKGEEVRGGEDKVPITLPSKESLCDHFPTYFFF